MALVADSQLFVLFVNRKGRRVNHPCTANLREYADDQQNDKSFALHSSKYAKICLANTSESLDALGRVIISPEVDYDRLLLNAELNFAHFATRLYL